MRVTPIGSAQELREAMTLSSGIGISVPEGGMDVRQALYIGGWTLLAGATAFAGVDKSINPERADAITAVCTTPSGEVSNNKYPGTTTGFDMSVDTIAFSQQPCVGYEYSASTNLRNRSTSLIAGPYSIAINGTLKVIDSIKRIEIDGVTIPIKTRGVDVINSGDRVFEKYGGGPFDSIFDRNYKRTKMLYYGNTYFDVIGKNSTREIRLYMTPNSTEASKLYPDGAYLQISAGVSNSGDINYHNNGASRDIIVFDNAGKPAPVPPRKAKPDELQQKIASSIPRPVVGITRGILTAKQEIKPGTGVYIKTEGDGAHPITNIAYKYGRGTVNLFGNTRVTYPGKGKRQVTPRKWFLDLLETKQRYISPKNPYTTGVRFKGKGAANFVMVFPEKIACINLIENHIIYRGCNNKPIIRWTKKQEVN